MPSSFIASPGSVRFDLGGALSSEEPIEIWLPAPESDPSVWLQQTNSSWLQVPIVQSAKYGDLIALSVNIPGSQESLTLAIGEPFASPTALVPQVFPPVHELGASDSLVVTDFEKSGPIASSPVRSALILVTLPVPNDGHEWQLETSTTLFDWTNANVWPGTNAPTISLELPASDRARFFRWRLKD